jgi:hypothetical protein
MASENTYTTIETDTTLSVSPVLSQVCCMTDSPEQQGQMSAILKEAFCVAHTELASVFPSGQTAAAGHSAPCPLEDSPGRQLRDDRTVALLEKYSEMLLFIAEKKMDSS